MGWDYVVRLQRNQSSGTKAWPASFCRACDQAIDKNVVIKGPKANGRHGYLTRTKPAPCPLRIAGRMWGPALGRCGGTFCIVADKGKSARTKWNTSSLVMFKLNRFTICKLELLLSHSISYQIQLTNWTLWAQIDWPFKSHHKPNYSQFHRNSAIDGLRPRAATRMIMAKSTEDQFHTWNGSPSHCQLHHKTNAPQNEHFGAQGSSPDAA